MLSSWTKMNLVSPIASEIERFLCFSGLFFSGRFNALWVQTAIRTTVITRLVITDGNSGFNGNTLSALVIVLRYAVYRGIDLFIRTYISCLNSIDDSVHFLPKFAIQMVHEWVQTFTIKLKWNTNRLAHRRLQNVRKSDGNSRFLSAFTDKYEI